MAVKRWTGNAVKVVDQYSVTIANTWAAADTCTLSINGLDLVLTIGTDVTTADVANALNAAINASSKDSGLISDETRNIGGQEIRELTEVSSTVSGSVVTVTANVAGLPVIFTVSQTTAGSGTATKAQTSTATGPNFFDNADNWNPSLPATTDLIRFDSGSTNCSYGLNYIQANSLVLDMERTTDFGGTIGLPVNNPNGYVEYRQRYLDFFNTSGTNDIWFFKGENGGIGNGQTFLDLESETYDIHVLDAGPVTPGKPNIEVIGGAINLDLRKSSLVVEPQTTDTSVRTALSSAVVGTPGGDGTQARLQVGKECLWGSGATLKVYSGEVTLYNDFANATPATATIFGGVVRFAGEGQGAVNNITLHTRGTAVLMADVVYGTVLNIGGTLDCNQDERSKTITALTLYPGCTYLDRGNVVTLSALTIVGDSLDAMKIEGTLGL